MTKNFAFVRAIVGAALFGTILFGADLAVLVFSARSEAAECTYFASPTGGGNGSSQQSPFRVSDAWSVLGPGETLCLVDGTYRGGAAMISPSEQGADGNFNGKPGSPITIRALHDGKVLIDGQFDRRPIWLRGSSYINIEGINACCSSAAVVGLSKKAKNNTFRRVGAWDALDGGAGSGTNNHVWDISDSGDNLIEDSFGFGTGRYILVTFDSGGKATTSNTIRRFWARWEGYDSQMGPRAPLQISYGSRGTLCENCIATWSGERQSARWGCCNFGIGGGAPPSNAPTPGVRVLGSIGYVKAGAPIPEMSFLGPEAGGSYWTFKDTVVAIDPSITWVSPAGLYGCGSIRCSSNIAQGLVLMGSMAPTVSWQWNSSEVEQCGGKDSCSNVFTKTANICTRYVDGVATSAALWPWPMNARILEATSSSGHTPENVTETIESIFGAIPAQCRD